MPTPEEIADEIIRKIDEQSDIDYGSATNWAGDAARTLIIKAIEAERATVRSLRAERLPKLTEAMMRAACKAHYRTENIDAVDLTFDERSYTFRQAFRRMWRGIRRVLTQEAGRGK